MESVEKIYNHDLEAKTESSEISKELKRVMSDANVNERLNSVIQVFSSKSVKPNHPLDTKTDKFDLAQTLRLISLRFNEQGFAPKYSGITFKDVTSNGIDASASYWPTMTGLVLAIAKLPKAFKTSPTRKVIRNINGIVKPGEILLVLGRPGAGCSSLLKTLGGETEGFTSVDGELKYDGASMEDMHRHFRREIIYNPECKLISDSGSFLYFIFTTIP